MSSQSDPYNPDATEKTLVECLGEAMSRLDRRLGGRAAVLIVNDASRRAMRVAAAYGVAAAAVRPRSRLGVAGRVAQTGQPIVVPTIRHEPMVLAELSDPDTWEQDFQSLVSVPVAVQGRCVGALSIYFTKGLLATPQSQLEATRSLSSTLADRLLIDSSPPVPTRAGTAEAGIFEYANMIGVSPAMRRIYEEVGQVARTSATALLLGESGTGKELVAHAIHANSERASRPFIKINSAAFPEALFESELFGHERGAFTGAVARKKGRLDRAQGGTLFLDEIGDLLLSTQAKLLRVLQSREYERLGGTETLKANVRLIAATNKDLTAAVAAGTFREDLYYRLNVFTITLPPLRERHGDVPVLAQYFLEKFACEHRRDVRKISSVALDLLGSHTWPGNVRELENALERAVVSCPGIVIEEVHLPEAVRRNGPLLGASNLTLTEAVERLEKKMIGDALGETNGNFARAARALGTTERIVRYKANKYGLLTSGRTARGSRLPRT